MASRRTLHPQAAAHLAALVQALRKSGDNTQLVALRATRLLQWLPNQERNNREGWLRGVLPEPWHYDKVMEALAKSSASTSQPAIKAKEVDASRGASPVGRQVRRRGNQ